MRYAKRYRKSRRGSYRSKRRRSSHRRRGHSVNRRAQIGDRM